MKTSLTPKKSKKIDVAPSEPNESPIASQTPESKLAEKLKEIRGLMNVVDLYSGQGMLRWQKERVEALEYGLTERLNALAVDSKIKEADIKIEQFNKLLDVFRKPNPNPQPLGTYEL